MPEIPESEFSKCCISYKNLSPGIQYKVRITQMGFTIHTGSGSKAWDGQWVPWLECGAHSADPGGCSGFSSWCAGGHRGWGSGPDLVWRNRELVVLTTFA